MLLQLTQISVLIHGKHDRLAVVPAGKLHRIHQLNTIDALFTVNKQGLFTTNCRDKVVDDALVCLDTSVEIFFGE